MGAMSGSKHAPAILRVMLLMALMCACALWTRPVQAQAAEHQVKAAFLYKFLGFVDWPAEVFDKPDSPLVIGVLGADLLADELAAVVTERTAHGRRVVARKVQAGESLAGLHMLFVGRADSGRLPSLLDSAKGQPLLTVTESDEAFARGSAINFVLVDNKVRFDVAPRAAELGNLKISSRLLGVARKVVAGPS
jgi:hypothetical protein